MKRGSWPQRSGPIQGDDMPFLSPSEIQAWDAHFPAEFSKLTTEIWLTLKKFSEAGLIPLPRGEVYWVCINLLVSFYFSTHFGLFRTQLFY